MLDAYASYLRALAQPAHARAHREARTAARTARTNAQASIERMRSEPATPAGLLALAQALFANGNRLARTRDDAGGSARRSRRTCPKQVNVSALRRPRSPTPCSGSPARCANSTHCARCPTCAAAARAGRMTLQARTTVGRTDAAACASATAWSTTWTRWPMWSADARWTRRPCRQLGQLQPRRVRRREHAGTRADARATAGLHCADAEDRFPRPYPAPRLAQPGGQVRRRPLSGDDPYRRPPSHLQGQPVLPRGVGLGLRPADAHRRLRALRRRRAGDLHRAGAVLVLGAGPSGAGAASPPEQPHGRAVPRSIRGTTPASARCRCRRRSWPSANWNAASTNWACKACRSARIAATGTWTRRSCSRSSRRPPISAPRCWCIRGT